MCLISMTILFVIESRLLIIKVADGFQDVSAFYLFINITVDGFFSNMIKMVKDI